ncbi:pyridoxamine 5'-phosphate oxidase family protein [Streptosporangium sp. NPDC006930]|uniref:pyridoxamine 5'-phosphate oxidase family protein n=1 Tax=unclassified Streptosporangium TaxID=2632669 RepID=UPI003421F511
MSNPPLPEEAVAMLKKPNPAVITTLQPDGRPVSTATWYLWDDGMMPDPTGAALPEPRRRSVREEGTIFGRASAPSIRAHAV